MKIVVTGGAGFIGTNALHYLQGKYPSAELLSFDIGQPIFPLEGVNYIHGDIRSYLHLKSVLKDTDVVFHFAAELGTHETFHNPDVANSVNISGSINLLELSRLFGYKIFVASKPNVWLNPYSISKEAMEQYCLMYFQEYQVQVSILKFFSIYGPYQYVHKYQKAVPYFIHQALLNEPLTIYGDGEQKADFLYAYDAIKAADIMLENNIFGNVIEFASGVGTKVNDLAKIIIKLTGSKSELNHVPMRQGETRNSVIVADLSKAHSDLKYLPEVNLYDGLSKTVDFYTQLHKTSKILF